MGDKPKIIDVVNASPDGLLDFLMQLPGTMEAQIFYALLIGSLVGMVAHYLVRWREGDIAGSLWAYLFYENPRRSILSIFGIITWSATEAATGLFFHEGQFVGWALVIISGIKTGYAGDSLLNKGIRSVWSEDKREAREMLSRPETQTPQPKDTP